MIALEQIQETLSKLTALYPKSSLYADPDEDSWFRWQLVARLLVLLPVKAIILPITNIASLSNWRST